MATPYLLIAPDSTEPMADADISAAIERLFTTQKGMNEHWLDVTTREGLVTLAGTVSNLRARQEAERDARHVVGVGGVHNLLKIRPKRPVADEDIRQNILAALARNVNNHLRVLAPAATAPPAPQAPELLELLADAHR